MITAITEKNRAKYDALFAKATTALKNKANSGSADVSPEFKEKYSEKNFDRIETLEQYFNCIGDLKAIDLKYTVLPVDETYFEIDANSRMIDVPKDTFKKNGVGIVGDQVAEIIYFRIDRYFDFMDLASNNIDIVIQWQRSDKYTGTSGIWVKDFNTYTDKLVFGWPLDKEVMEVSGNLDFSVRFIMYGDQEKTQVVYSLSTQTAHVNINSGLNFDPSELITDESVYNMIFNRIQNSNTMSNDDIEIPLPIFVLSKFSPAFGTEELLILDGAEYKIDGENSIELQAQAYKPSTHGVLSYSFTKGSEGSLVDAKNYEAREVLIKVVDRAQFNENIAYYDKNGNYLEVDQTQDLEDGRFKKENPFYEKICKALIKKAGTYYFAAINTYNSKNSMQIAPQGYKIPGPCGIQIVPTENKCYIIHTNNDELTFAADNLIINKMGDNTENPTNLEYEWGKGIINANGEPEFVSINTGKKPTIDYTPVEEGNYIVKIHATKNNETTVTLSDMLSVYQEAIKPNVELISDDKEYRVGEILECRIINSASMKNLSYKWYYKNGNDVEEITQRENPQTCIIPEVALGKKIYCDIVNFNGFEDNKKVTTVETNYIGSAE